MTDSLFKAAESDPKLARIETFPIEFTIDTTNDPIGSTEPEAEQASAEILSVTTSTDTASQSLVISTFYKLWNPWNWFIPSLDQIETIETNMFRCVKTQMDRYFVSIRNNSLKIWTISANTESKNIPIVLVHGFCGGIAMWIPNIDFLSESRPLYAFDLLGFGRSSRPNFSSDPIVAETQFVESIEDWRKEMKIEQFILLGHSFGGYLSTAYSIKYPQRVRALILADPWGFPTKPENRSDVRMPMWIRAVAKVSQHFGPLSLLRVTGTFGVRVLKRLRPDFRRKYLNLLDDPDHIYDYIYHANRAHPSGEAGFRAIAEYFGYAKNPMIHRIDKVSDNIPIWFIYGSRSWIDSESGVASISLRQNSVSTTVKLITGAGHHVYADKPNEFNEYVKYIFELIEEYDLREEGSDAVQIEH